MAAQFELSSKWFRSAAIEERREKIAQHYQWPLEPDSVHLADHMVENAIGYKHIPIGLVPNIIIDSKSHTIPLATEEPSVIAALQYAGRILSLQGEIRTQGSPPVMSAQVFVTDCAADALHLLASSEDTLKSVLNGALQSLHQRGGGLRSIAYRIVEVPSAANAKVVCVEFWVDVRDSMGANRLNTAAELLAPKVAAIIGGRVLYSIVSNAATKWLTTASFTLPVTALRRTSRAPAYIANAIVVAAEIAHHDYARAVTHNKGIMNGISALALATGNDTRAIEAAVHAYASRKGGYHGLSYYILRGDTLHGTLTIPAPFALVGGAVGVQSDSQAALRILGVQSSSALAQIAVAVGLIQNFAALLALVGEGIQAGHMHKHARRLKWQHNSQPIIKTASTFRNTLCSKKLYE